MNFTFDPKVEKSVSTRGMAIINGSRVNKNKVKLGSTK